MLCELAVTPKLFDCSMEGDDSDFADELLDFLQKLSYHGMIANLDKGKWYSVVREYLTTENGWTMKSRSKLVAYLEHLDKSSRLVRHPFGSVRNPNSSKEWLDLALESHRRICLDWIVVDKAIEEPFPSGIASITTLEHLKSSQKWTERDNEVVVRLSESSYVSLIRPLLRHAKWLDIVDPYLQPGTGNNPMSSRFIEICTKLMADRGYDPIAREIRIHVSEHKLNMPLDNAIAAWNDRLKQIKERTGTLHKLQVIVWGALKTDHATYMHSRFLFTDQCGVSSNHSFICREEATKEETEWRLLGDKMWFNRRELFRCDVSPYQFLGQTNEI
jgi:hypothetical protein